MNSFPVIWKQLLSTELQASKAAFTPNPTQWKCSVSHSFSFGPPVVLLWWSGDDFCHRLVQHLKLSLAHHIGHHSLCHAAAASHASRQSDTNATQWTTRLNITQWVMAKSLQMEINVRKSGLPTCGRLGVLYDIKGKDKSTPFVGNIASEFSFFSLPVLVLFGKT